MVVVYFCRPREGANGKGENPSEDPGENLASPHSWDILIVVGSASRC